MLFRHQFNPGTFEDGIPVLADHNPNHLNTLNNKMLGPDHINHVNNIQVRL